MRTARLLLMMLAFLATAARPAQAAARARPNFLIILADDLGYGDLGVQGAKDVKTPHIDRLAQAGVRCTSGYVSGPYCSPTRAGLMTGRYQQRFGHEFNPGGAAQGQGAIGLSLKETTLPQLLQSAGYRTALVGKWHLGNAPQFHPQKRGFDEFFGFLGGAHPYTKPGMGANAILRGTQPAGETEYLTDALGREATAFLDRNKTGPFLLYLAFNAVHMPLEATEKYLKRFPDIQDEKRRTYAAMLAAMDDAVSAVLTRLKVNGQEDNTLVVFFSDNGGPEGVNGSDNGPLRGVKATTWEGGVRVPFFLRWPGRLPAGKTYDQPVIQLDLLPTFLAAAGVKPPSDLRLDGVDLLPYLTGKNEGVPHEVLYWRFGGQTAIRAGDWKLTKAAAGRGTAAAGAALRRAPSSMAGAGLYNLREDIGEEKDRAAEHPEKVKELTALWDKWNVELVPPAWGPPAQANPNKPGKPNKPNKPGKPDQEFPHAALTPVGDLPLR